MLFACMHVFPLILSALCGTCGCIMLLLLIIKLMSNKKFEFHEYPALVSVEACSVSGGGFCMTCQAFIHKKPA